MADAFHEALTMPEADKRLKHHYNYEYTLRHTGFFWAKTFLQELLHIAPEITLPLLNFPLVKKAYDKAEARLLLLDYDGMYFIAVVCESFLTHCAPLGTLTPISRLPTLARPSQQVLQALTLLANDARNTIFIISGTPDHLSVSLLTTPFQDVTRPR